MHSRPSLALLIECVDHLLIYSAESRTGAVIIVGAVIITQEKITIPRSALTTSHHPPIISLVATLVPAGIITAKLFRIV